MSSQIPIKLTGNLGDRHRSLNSLVSNCKESIERIIALPESTPVDRIFKIKLASKRKHVEYILKNLKDDDMLYVSIALKSKWLLHEDYKSIINPVYLETSLYPEMITTAVNKMKHWIHLNMRDPLRCKEFYDYYSEKDCDYAFKFLCKSPEKFLLEEFPKNAVLEKLTPHRFKLLCEKTPHVAKIFVEMLKNNKMLFKKYSTQDHSYFESIKCTMKTDVDIFLDIIEQHFINFKRLSTVATKFIMTQRKKRVMLKPELYTSQILNLNALAECLTEEECEEMVINLARAIYLKHWFSYKNVEPFIKRLDHEKRGIFKKKVFVDKDLGDMVADWSYALPTSLYNLHNSDAIDVFVDEEESLVLYDNIGEPIMARQMHELSYRCAPMCDIMMKCKRSIMKPKTLLDMLFDEYRFKSFDKTLFELRKKIKSESSSQNRMYMMLVLVSKSGGKIENLVNLFKLLIEHHNEPSQVRAAIIRSLVKRAYVWRVPEDTWKELLVFGRGLGLDGNIPEADCDEGLHAVMIRNLLLNRDYDPAIQTAFIKKFTPLTDYSLTKVEKSQIEKQILSILIKGANAELNANTAAQILNYALDTLHAYHIKFSTCPEFITSIKNLTLRDQAATKPILRRLFDSKLGRKQLFKENFDLIQTDASYVNALKHDITILSVDTFLKAVVDENLKAEQFIRKLSIYFNGREDLAAQFVIAMKGAKIDKRLARPIAYLIGNELKPYMLEQDSKGVESKRFSASVRANAHITRPGFSVEYKDMRKYGAKLIANRVLICRNIEVDSLIIQLLLWKRTARLALILAQRSSHEADVFAAVAKMRPTIALKAALIYFRRQGDQSDLRIWEIVKPLITNLKKSIKENVHFLRNIKKVESIPIKIRAQYATEVFRVINEIDCNQSLSVLCHINHLLPKIEEDFIAFVLCDFIQKNRFIVKQNDYVGVMSANLYLSILGKYLIICKTEEIQTRRYQNVGQLYLDRLQSLWQSKDKKKYFLKYFKVLLNSLRNNEAFLNAEYVCCLPVMENIVKWMHNILPMEKHFELYEHLHLTMLYCKAIKKTVEQAPEVLMDKQKRPNEGARVVGEIFGKYIGREVHLLTKKYFDSIVTLYGTGLVNFLHSFNQGRFRMVPYIIKGLIEVTDGVECMAALILYDDNLHYMKEEEEAEVRRCLKGKNQIEMQFCFSDRSLVSVGNYI